MEHAIGTKITLEVVEGGGCKDCFFMAICLEDLTDIQCRKLERIDHKNIIYKEITDLQE